MIRYQIRIPKAIHYQIQQIERYIRDVLFSPQAAKKRKSEIIEGIKTLTTFPERGFDADEKIGRTILQGHKTYGIPIIDGKYIVLYIIDEKEGNVQITELLPTQSDYAKLFL